MSDASSSYTTFRVALATALLGSTGATLAWLFWLAIEAHRPEVLVTVAVGAVVGVVVQWFEHYVRVARAENQGAPAQHRSGRRLGVTLAWAAAFGFLLLATEHLVAEMIAQFLLPFLASLLTLVPAGAIIGWTLNRGREKDEGLVMLIANGVMVGIAITLVTAIIWSVSFGQVPWLALFSWWGLIGIGTRVVARGERNGVRPLDPIVAVVAVFAAIFLLNLLPVTQSSYRIFGPFANIPVAMRTMAAEIVQSPDLPATFWMQAEQRLRDEEERDAVTTLPPKVPAAGSPVATPDQVDLIGAVDRLVSSPTAAQRRANKPHLTPADMPDFIRSWLVILFFAAGAGAAPVVERWLRPVDYPSSETYRRDITLASTVLLTLMAACLYARHDRTRTTITTLLDADGLTQRVILPTRSPARGDSMVVRSVVMNLGRAPVSVVTICNDALRLDGILFAVRSGSGAAAGCGPMRVLDHGDSLVATAVTGAIADDAGVYVLSVRQLASPGRGIRIAMQVTERW